MVTRELSLSHTHKIQPCNYPIITLPPSLSLCLPSSRFHPLSLTSIYLSVCLLYLSQYPSLCPVAHSNLPIPCSNSTCSHYPPLTLPPCLSAMYTALLISIALCTSLSIDILPLNNSLLALTLSLSPPYLISCPCVHSSFHRSVHLSILKINKQLSLSMSINRHAPISL